MPLLRVQGLNISVTATAQIKIGTGLAIVSGTPDGRGVAAVARYVVVSLGTGE